MTLQFIFITRLQGQLKLKLILSTYLKRIFRFSMDYSLYNFFLYDRIEGQTTDINFVHLHLFGRNQSL